MLVQIPKVLNAEQLQMCREELGKAEWSDGRDSTGYLARAVQKVARDTPQQTATTDLAGVYHNLLRLWADA